MTVTARQKAIAIAPKFTSIASVFGSTFIIQAILRDKKKTATPFHRILLGMCLTDALSSTWFFLGTWPIPAGTEGVWGAVGNENTCIAQGFFSQLSLTTAMYNATLAVFYLLQIGYGWKNKRIRSRVEPLLHGIAIAIGLGTAIAGVPLKLYNNDYWECWISPLPTDCEESWKSKGESNCVRGDNASLYRWVFYYGPLWAAIVAVTVCMFMVYRAVLRKERSLDRYDSEHEHKFSKKVAVQGFWYCGAFYATWILPTITRLTQLILGDNTPFWLICLTATFVPIQGALNFLVYIRPRYKKYKVLRALTNWTEGVRKRVLLVCGCRSSTTDEEETEGNRARHFNSFFPSIKHSRDEGGNMSTRIISLFRPSDRRERESNPQRFSSLFYSRHYSSPLHSSEVSNVDACSGDGVVHSRCQEDVIHEGREDADQEDVKVNDEVMP